MGFVTLAEKIIFNYKPQDIALLCRQAPTTTNHQATQTLTINHILDEN
jgi:hypothetical protein